MLIQEQSFPVVSLSHPHGLSVSCNLSFLHRVATDHNVDNTTAILREWLVNVQNDYHYVEWRPDDETRCVSVRVT